METFEVRKPRMSGGAIVLFVFACIFFAVATIINVFWPILWIDVLVSLLSGEGEAAEVVGQILSIIIFFPIWLLTSPLSALISMVLAAFCIKHTKVAIILLVIVAVLFMINLSSVIAFFTISSSQPAALSLCCFA